MAQIIHRLPDGFVDIRTHDERKFFLDARDLHGMYGSSMPLNDFRNVCALKFYDMERAVGAKKRNVKYVANRELLPSRFSDILTAKDPSHLLKLRVDIGTLAAI